MKTVRRLLYGEVLLAVLLVTLGFLALFSFFDLVEELQAVGKYRSNGYTVAQALWYVALMAPNHLYELLPITVLIGTIFVMARLAQSSEFTILRTSGLGPGRALRALLQLGLVFVVLTFATGDYIAPWSDKAAQWLKSRHQGHITVGKTGAWLKEKQAQRHYAVNVGALMPETGMEQVRIFEFDQAGRLRAIMHSPNAQFGGDGTWRLQQVERTEFFDTHGPLSQVQRSVWPEWRWPTGIRAEMVATAVLRPERMGTLDLWRYVRHLQANGQSAQKYEIQFWKKVFYPLSCLVMVVLALPFAYLHFRSDGITSYVFGGVMAGISFVLLNNVLADLGALKGWNALLIAALPGFIYSLISLTAFAWLVLRR